MHDSSSPDQTNVAIYWDKTALQSSQNPCKSKTNGETQNSTEWNVKMKHFIYFHLLGQP